MSRNGSGRPTTARLSVQLLEDRTAPSASLVKDIQPGPADSSPSGLTEFEGKLYFRARDSVSGTELWSSDGTTTGTVSLDVRPGSDSFSPSGLVEFGGELILSGRESSGGTGIFASDGTAEGMRLLKSDIFFGSDESVVVGDQLFFVGTTTETGAELFVTDGTPGGTRLVKDINPEQTVNPFLGTLTGVASNPQLLTRIGDRVFFVAEDGTNGQELWVSDGTEAGTVLLGDINPGDNSPLSGPRDLAELNGKLYFTADDNGPVRRELYVSDGTPAGTTLLKNIDPEVGRSSFIFGVVNYQGKLYFRADDGAFGSFSQVWTSDGTASGTVPFNSVRNPHSFKVVGDQLFFAAETFSAGEEIWVSDGTVAGTRMVTDIGPGRDRTFPANFTDIDGTLFLTLDDGTGEGIWKTDGTAAGTEKVTSVPLPGIEFNIPQRFVGVGGKFFFVADQSASGREVWAADILDVDPPATRVLSVDAGQPLFQVTYTGADIGDGVDFLRVWVSVDGGAPELVSEIDLNGDQSTSGAVTYQASVDGVEHTYRFFSTAADTSGRTEPPPADGDVTVSAVFLPPPAVEGFDVNRGQEQRSLVRTLDVTLNHSSAADDLLAGLDTRVRLTRFGLDGGGPGTGVDLAGTAGTSGSVLSFDFGQQGLLVDGYYVLELDLDGDGSFETDLRFYRLQGDINGDRVVDRTDLIQFKRSLGATGPNLAADLDGDGDVDRFDYRLARANYLVSLDAGLELDD